MRLVISGYFGFGNTGDEAILAGTLATLRELEPALEVTVASGDPAATEKAHRVRAVPRAGFARLLRELRAANGLLSGGGGLLQDRTSSRPVAYYTGLMGLARLAGRPYAVFAQGLGPIRRAPNRSLARLALRHAAHVSLRDPASVQLARRWGVARPIDLVPDAALALRPPRGARTGTVVVAVRAWGRSTHLPELREAVGILAREHRVLAVPMQERVDRDATIALIRDVRGAEAVPPSASFDERLEAIGSASAVVGMRLHSLILAAAAGVPAVAIAYDPKVRAFAEQAGQPIVGDVAERLDPAAVAAAVANVLAADPEPYLVRVAELRARIRPGTAAALEALRR
jgi:polysaccharide pyruvyl transferase CsaB